MSSNVKETVGSLDVSLGYDTCSQPHLICIALETITMMTMMMMMNDPHPCLFILLPLLAYFLSCPSIAVELQVLPSLNQLVSLTNCDYVTNNSWLTSQ